MYRTFVQTHIPRKTRIEIEGGLYHVITRGNGRRDNFHSREDHDKFLQLLMAQKLKLPFYLYAYCLMTNHLHMLIERREDDIGRIMQRVLTAYTQYYNRKYKQVGHVLQGRYKAVLCQSERYLTKLVRYIHLNPVKANMVAHASDYPYSSHRAYLGIDPSGPLDAETVLRHFGVKKAVARKHFAAFVDGPGETGDLEAMLGRGGGFLGDEEFVDATIHRLGEHVPKGTPMPKPDLDAEALLAAVETVFEISRDEICGRSKAPRTVQAKEMLILCGHRHGASLAELARLTGLNSSTVARRLESARTSHRDNDNRRELASQVMTSYQNKRIAQLHD
ncbi:MAG: transposase [Pyrinomonadaceae bacterium]